MFSVFFSSKVFFPKTRMRRLFIEKRGQFFLLVVREVIPFVFVPSSSTSATTTVECRTD